MLDAGRAPEVIAGAIVFYDHADEGLRYVAAEAPRIDRRPDPMISLVLYRGLAEAGGLLQLESTLAPTEELLEAVQRELAKNGPAPRLAQPDWRRGEVEVAGWLDTEELAPLSLALGKPFLVGAPNVVLAARLDRAGAALAEAALRGDALPTALLWRLETLGLSGPLGVEVEADLRKMHDRLTAEGALTVPIGRARIAKTWEEFVTENLIRVEVVDESGDVESNRAEAVRRVGEELTAAMFLPAPPAEKPTLLENGAIAPIELSFRLTMRREELEQTRRWSFKERRAVPVVHYAAASLIGFLHGRSASDHILHVDLAQTPRREILVRSERNLSSIGLAAVETDLAFGEPGEPERTVALTDAAPESRFIVDHTLDARLYWRARSRFDPLKTSSEEAETEWFEANGDYVFVAASEAFPARRLTLLVGSAELSWIDHIEVRVSAPGEPERTIVLDQGRTIVDLQFPGAGEGPIRIAAQWNGLEGEPRLSAEPFETEEEMVILDSPFGPSINILAIPATSSETLNSTLELRYASPGFVDERTLHWESSDGDSRKAALRRPRGEASVYEYRTTVLDQSGQLAQSNWLRSTASVLIVDHRTMLTAHRARVLALGGGPAGRGSMAIELTLEAGERQTTAVMEGAEDLVELTLLSDENGPPPELTSREFRNTGEVVETHWREIETVVLPLPATN